MTQHSTPNYIDFLLRWLIVILALIVFVALALSLMEAWSMIADKPSSSNILRQSTLLSTITISAGVLVAILSFAREREKNTIEQQRHISEIILGITKNSFKAVIDLLSDQNNNRIIWLRAARTLRKIMDIKCKITSEEYLEAYELEEERARNELYAILSLKDEQSGGRTPLPPQFFYGIEDWRTCNSLNDAAIKASSKIVAYSMSIDEVPPQPHSKPLAPKSVVVIFDFIEYPTAYKDPLDFAEAWVGDWSNSHGIDQGAKRYVAHAKETFAIDGKLHSRKDLEGG